MDNDTAKEYVNQALKIQSAWRAYKVRKNIREVEEKINEIENNSGNKLPKSIHLTDEEILKAVTKIQTNLRGYMARKHFKNLLERNQSLDGIQEETNSETPNVKTNITLSSDEDILNTLKQLDEVIILCTSPEFVSGERIRRNVNEADCTHVSSDLLDASNSSAGTSLSNNSLNKINCSSSNVSADTSNMNPHVILNSKESDDLSVNDNNSISIKSSNNINTQSKRSVEQNELESKICDENESDIPRPVPVNILEKATSDLPNNLNDQQVCNTEAHGSLKKSKATDDLVKLAEEFENGEDSSKAIDDTLKTQKSFEENDSTYVPDTKDFSLPDKN
ncbi:hypothetical protein WA026_002438 [Henosepilachna vigintioctopunctata]|uniref:Uncharacterized protein n=1 Tax=Henosepilachna vigintioctopunctata TaxID=420089 RepID=A0AAW1U149_9CUCU